jgi:hypothetical protein
MAHWPHTTKPNHAKQSLFTLTHLYLQLHCTSHHLGAQGERTLCVSLETALPIITYLILQDSKTTGGD